MLIQRGSDINALCSSYSTLNGVVERQRVTPLFLAIKTGRADVTRVLLRNGADASHLESGGTSMREMLPHYMIENALDIDT